VRRLAILPAVILLAALLAACGAPTEVERSAPTRAPAASAASGPGGDADALMAEARALATKTTALEAQLWENHLMMALVAPDAAAARPELAKAGSLLDEMRANEKAIAVLLERVVGLDAGEELTTYARQQKEIAELRLLSMAPVADLLARVENAYKQEGKPSQADLEKLFAAMEPSDPDDPLAHLEQKGQASREYFRRSELSERYYLNNGLGDAYDTPGWQSEEEAGAFPLADGIEFEGPMATEEVPPPKMWGSFHAPIAEAMQAERSTLESDGWSVNVSSAGEDRGVMTARNSFWQATLTFERTGEDAGTVIVRMTQL
jgi:hypothetical protein